VRITAERALARIDAGNIAAVQAASRASHVRTRDLTPKRRSVTMAEVLTMQDLREPRLTAIQRDALAAAEATPLQLSVDAALEAATQRTGLSDFGDEDFRERLDLIMSAVGWEGSTQLSQLGSYRRIINKLVDRLLTAELVKQHPEIRDEPIEAPLVVAGLPRSGTTHLLNLLAADSRLQSMPYWQVLRPVPLMPEDQIGADGVDPRWKRVEASWEQAQRMNPFAAAHHPMDPDHFSEDGELQMADFSSYVWEFSIHAPQWRDHYLAHDQTPHYEYQKLMMQVLQFQRGERQRWIVKAPQHFEQLPAIMNVFPDAFVIFTHRDPVASLQSIVHVQSYTARWKELGPPDLEYHLEYWADRYRTLLDRYGRDAHLVPEAQRFDVLFHEFVGDDIDTARRILEAAGLPMNETAERELLEFMDAHQRGANGRIAFDLRGNYAADPAEVRERYAAYMALMPVKVEVT
jgi:hypothetical protein